MLTLPSYLSDNINVAQQQQQQQHSRSCDEEPCFVDQVVSRRTEAGLLVAVCSMFHTQPLLGEMSAHVHPWANITNVSNTPG